MLSIEDFYREMGKNIFICPLDVENFRDNSIDLTASEFAWTADGHYIYDETDDKIVIPPHTTACILTRESIYVTEKIGGTYHSRVSLVKQGFGHIGTMLDPKYCGQSLIMLHNITNNDQVIKGIKKSKHGVRLVSLALYYIDTPIYEDTLSTPPSHQDKISAIDKENRYKKWIDENHWVNNPRNLKQYFKENYEREFIKKRKIYAQKKNFINRFVKSDIGVYLIKYSVVAFILFVTYVIIQYWFKPRSSDWEAFLIATSSCLIGIVTNDIQRSMRR